jgi:hypothetical protein
MSKTPKFEKRHFEYLAEILQTINLVNKYAESNKLTTDFVKNINKIYIDYFAKKLALTNDNFDQEKFVEACTNE